VAPTHTRFVKCNLLRGRTHFSYKRIIKANS